jgi:ABC-type polysaccharide/polyol phosphate export permease
VSSTTETSFPSAVTLAVFDPADVPSEPERQEFYRHRTALVPAVRRLWSRRDMVIALAERDVRASYKQAILGLAWALISPVIQVVIFTLIFTRVKLFQIPHIPYAIYAYVGILCWSYFAGSLGAGGNSLVSNMGLLQKTHFPRECFPLSQLLEQTIYTTIALIPLGILLLYYGFVPKIQVVYIPLFMLIEVVFTAGVVLIMSACIVYLRDLVQVMGLIIQIGLYASPVVWPLKEVPHALQPLYAFVNPIAPIIDSVRKTMLLGLQPDWGLLGVAAISAALYFVVGFKVFKRLEVAFADIS